MGSAGGETPDLDDAATWDRLLEDLDLAAILVAIESRIGAGLGGELSAEDVLQDTLIAAWTAREHVEWRGRRAFRGWLLTIAENRIRDGVRARNTLRRGGGKSPALFSELSPKAGTSRGSIDGLFGRSTTPSQLARHRERATAMTEALATLDEGEREVVRLRLFEGESTAQVAERLGIGESAVKHRLRSGSRHYRDALRRQLSTQTNLGAARSAGERRG